jgi:hypothetical protein
VDNLVSDDLVVGVDFEMNFDFVFDLNKTYLKNKQYDV